MTTRAVTARLLAATVIAAVALTATPPPATVSAQAPAETRYQTKVFKVVNNKRANHDRVKLRKNKCLQRFANRQAQKMAKQRRLSHQSLPRIQRRCGVGYVGENVACCRGPKATVRAWMHSKGHRANILFRKYRITGVAARRGGGRWWVAQVFGRRG